MPSASPFDPIVEGRPTQHVALVAARRLLHALDRVELAVALSALVGVLLLVATQVIARQFDHSFWWAQEWTELAIMYAYFLGISHIYRSRHMITVGFLVDRFDRRAQVRLYAFAQLLVIGFCSLIAFESIRIAPRELAFPSFVIGVPRFYWTLPLIIGSISMALTSLYFLVAVAWEASVRTDDWTIEELEAESAVVPGSRDPHTGLELLD